MMKKIGHNLGKFFDYMGETGVNKLCALVLFAAGWVPVYLDGDATAVVFMLPFVLYMFFTRDRVFG